MGQFGASSFQSGGPSRANGVLRNPGQIWRVPLATPNPPKPTWDMSARATATTISLSDVSGQDWPNHVKSWKVASWALMLHFSLLRRNPGSHPSHLCMPPTPCPPFLQQRESQCVSSPAISGWLRTRAENESNHLAVFIPLVITVPFSPASWCLGPFYLPPPIISLRPPSDPGLPAINIYSPAGAPLLDPLSCLAQLSCPTPSVLRSLCRRSEHRSFLRPIPRYRAPRHGNYTGSPSRIEKGLSRSSLSLSLRCLEATANPLGPL